MLESSIQDLSDEGLYLVAAGAQARIGSHVEMNWRGEKNKIGMCTV